MIDDYLYRTIYSYEISFKYDTFQWVTERIAFRMPNSSPLSDEIGPTMLELDIESFIKILNVTTKSGSEY